MTSKWLCTCTGRHAQLHPPRKLSDTRVHSRFGHCSICSDLDGGMHLVAMQRLEAGPFARRDLDAGARSIVPIPLPLGGAMVLGEDVITYLTADQRRPVVTPVEPTTFEVPPSEWLRYLNSRSTEFASLVAWMLIFRNVRYIYSIMNIALLQLTCAVDRKSRLSIMLIHNLDQICCLRRHHSYVVCKRVGIAQVWYLGLHTQL